MSLPRLRTRRLDVAIARTGERLDARDQVVHIDQDGLALTGDDAQRASGCRETRSARVRWQTRMVGNQAEDCALRLALRCPQPGPRSSLFETRRVERDEQTADAGDVH